MDIKSKDRQFIAVEYPGTVINVKNMMKQFGGEVALGKTLHDPTRRLELRFRPGDPYSKPAYGDKFTTTSMVVEIVRKRKKIEPNTSLQVSNDQCNGSENYGIELIGFVKDVYRFKALSDFQLLPAEFNSDGTAKSLLPKLIPQGLPNHKWFDEEVPLFVVPLLFSRFDSASNVYLDGVKVPRKPAPQKKEQSLIGTSRPKRASFAVNITFESREPCLEPQEKSLEMLQMYPQQSTLKKQIENLYKERPVWSRTALMYRLKADVAHIRYALACTAYHFTTGPWRTLWVKFGYDPRTDPESKKYQLLDIRLKASINLDTIDHSRSKAFDYYVLPAKAQKGALKKPSIKADLLIHSCQEKQPSEASTSSSKPPNFILASGQLPSTRQCYYQFCDVYIDEVQKLVHQNDGQEQFCHEKDGWCKIGVVEKCREIVCREIERSSLQKSDKSLAEK